MYINFILEHTFDIINSVIMGKKPLKAYFPPIELLVVTVYTLHMLCIVKIFDSR